MTIPSGVNQALDWPAKAANAPDGAAWSSRTLQIVPVTVPSSAPTAPTDIAATALSRASIRVTWSDNSNNEDGFRVYRWSVPDGPDWVVAGTTAAGTTTFTDTGLEPSTHYYYFTCAFNAGGEACASLQLDAKTLSALPVAPTDVSATTVASTSIRFTWADNSDNEDGFRVYRWSLPDGGKQWAGRHHDGAGRDDIPGHRAAAVSRVLLLCLRIQRGGRSVCDRRAWLAQRDDDRWPPNGSEDRDRLTCQYGGPSLVERTDERWRDRDHDLCRDVVPLVDGPVQRAV